MGALIVCTEKPLSVITVEAIGSLASDVSLAVEAAGLTEDLHDGGRKSVSDPWSKILPTLSLCSTKKEQPRSPALQPNDL